MPRRFAAIALILLLVGGNAAMVQAVAWAGMLAERSARMSWSAAVDTTFSGEERCPMCHAAAALRDEPVPGLPKPEMKQVGKLPSAPPGLPPRLDPSSADSRRLTMPPTTGRPDEFRPAPQPPPPRTV